MPVKDQAITDRYALYHSDCMEVLPTLPSESVGLSVYSPPFPELYQYSDDPRDMSNCTKYSEAIDQYRYVVAEISRLTMPGRLSAVHCTDLKRGILYQCDFPGDVIRVHEDAGLHYFCRIVIWKDPWEFARRTRMKTLMHKTLVEDAARSRIAPADHLLIFKKPGINPRPVTHANGFSNYAGARAIPPELVRACENYRGDQRKNVLSHWIYRQYASPVWMDIRRGRLMPHRDCKENPEERHVCPLQMDVIDRCLALWSNPEDVVLTPFMGVGSEVYGAVMNGRIGIGIELKETYYRQALRNVKAAVRKLAEGDLVAATEIEEEEEELEGDEGESTDWEPAIVQRAGAEDRDE